MGPDTEGTSNRAQEDELSRLGELTKDKIISGFYSSEWDEFDLDDSHVEKSETKLAKTYAENIHWVCLGIPAAILLSVALIDWVFSINPLIYGLCINLYASIVMAVPSLKGVHSIALITAQNTEAIRRIEAQRTVFTNIGFALFIVGYGIQILVLI